MLTSATDFVNHKDIRPIAGEARLRWLRGTRQLDVMHPRLVQRMLKTTAGISGEQGKAVALHELVKTLPFGCVPDYSALRASDVLALGYGDCFSKGMLFVAMLRAAQIPARLRFVSLPVGFLYGIVDLQEATIMHAMCEVLIHERWCVTDSYVPDTRLQTSACRLLRAQSKLVGYGVHLRGHQTWDGIHDASAQCFAGDAGSMPVVDWGVADDPESFYADENHSELRRNFAARLKWRLAAPLVNKRVAAVRQTPAA